MTPWTVAQQAPLSIRFSMQEYWRGLPRPPPGDLPHQGIEPMSLVSPALAAGFFTASTPGRPIPFQIIFPYGLLQDNKYSFLWYTVGPGGFPFYI